MLDGLGLSAAEETVYAALVDVASASVPQLRDRCPEVAVVSALTGLERHGLVSRLPGRPVRYVASPPDVALETLVRGRERELAQARTAIDGLAARYRASRPVVAPQEVVEVVTEREQTLQRWEMLQRSARYQVRSFDRPPYVTDPTDNPIESELLASGIVYR